MNTIYPNISGVNYESLVDGEGVRATIYLSGCSHNCLGCHNPETHDPAYGAELRFDNIEQLAFEINKRSYLSGITLSGGDPFFDSRKTVNFLSTLLPLIDHSRLTVWAYTGREYEDITNSESRFDHKLLSLTDVLVDGPFVHSLADKTLRFRGSSNQRIIDVQKSLKKGEIVIHSSQEAITA